MVLHEENVEKKFLNVLSESIKETELKYKNKSTFKKRFIEAVNCSEKSFYRYRNMESCPDFKTTLKIFSLIYGITDREELLAKLPNPVKSKFLSSGKMLEDINDILSKSFIHTVIYWLTANNACVTEKSLLFEFGKQYKNALQDLLKFNIICEVESGIYSTGQVRAAVDSSYVLNKIEKLIQFFRKASADNSEQTNACYGNIIKLSDLGELKAYNAIWNLMNTMQEIEREHPGDNSIILAMLLENLDLTFDRNKPLETLQ